MTNARLNCKLVAPLVCMRSQMCMFGDTFLKAIPILVASTVSGIWVLVMYLARDSSAAYIKGFGWATYSEHPFIFAIRMYGIAVLALLLAVFFTFAVWARLTKKTVGLDHFAAQRHRYLGSLGGARIAAIEHRSELTPPTPEARVLLGKVQALRKQVISVEDRDGTNG